MAVLLSVPLHLKFKKSTHAAWDLRIGLEKKKCSLKMCKRMSDFGLPFVCALASALYFPRLSALHKNCLHLTGVQSHAWTVLNSWVHKRLISFLFYLLEIKMNEKNPFELQCKSIAVIFGSRLRPHSSKSAFVRKHWAHMLISQFTIRFVCFCVFLVVVFFFSFCFAAATVNTTKYSFRKLLVVSRSH